MLSGDGTWAVWCPRERSRGQTCISELSSLSPLGSGRGGHHYGGWGQLLPRTPASLGGPWGGTPQPQSSPRNGVSPIHPARVQWGGQPRGTGHHARVDLAHCDQGLRKGPSRPGPPHLPAFFTKPRSASSTSHSSQRKHPGCQLLFMALMTRPMMNSPGRERSLQASTGHTPLPSAAPPKPPSALSWVILELREPMPAGGLWACPLPGPATHSGQCGCVEGGGTASSLTTGSTARSKQHLEVMFAVLPAFKLQMGQQRKDKQTPIIPPDWLVSVGWDLPSGGWTSTLCNCFPCREGHPALPPESTCWRRCRAETQRLSRGEGAPDQGSRRGKAWAGRTQPAPQRARARPQRSRGPARPAVGGWLRFAQGLGPLVLGAAEAGLGDQAGESWDRV